MRGPGVVGAGGVGFFLVDALRYNEFARSGMAFIVVVGVTLTIDAVPGRTRRRIVAGPGGDPTDAEMAVAVAAAGGEDLR